MNPRRPIKIVLEDAQHAIFPTGGRPGEITLRTAVELLQELNHHVVALTTAEGKFTSLQIDAKGLKLCHDQLERDYRQLREAMGGLLRHFEGLKNLKPVSKTALVIGRAAYMEACKQ